MTPDNGEAFIAEMENATLTNIKGFQAENADLTLTNDRSDLEADDDGRQDSRGRPSVAPHTWPAPASWTADMLPLTRWNGTCASWARSSLDTGNLCRRSTALSKTRHIEDPAAPEANPAPHAPGRDAPRPTRFGWAA
ncbi:MAG TPA: alkyl sulfatase C-terminal domain-containing protein, partial [Gemmatimonadaceae bacterium]|nr:alkyl sulfatase C-terminal domain-containing protein [Gemmatimonadaceae bacterium]